MCVVHACWSLCSSRLATPVSIVVVFVVLFLVFVVYQQRRRTQNGLLSLAIVMNSILLALVAPLLAAAAGFVVGFLSGALTFLPVAGSCRRAQRQPIVAHQIVCVRPFAPHPALLTREQASTCLPTPACRATFRLCSAPSLRSSTFASARCESGRIDDALFHPRVAIRQRQSIGQCDPCVVPPHQQPAPTGPARSI